jgi:hydroxymethylbilane synthase
MNRPDRPLRLGTRGSPLALAQARAAAAALQAANGWDAGAVEIVPMVTSGDRVKDRPLAELGGKALWTKELDRALLSGEVDACVHSMKDVESERPAELCVAAMLERADVRDRLIGAETIDALPQAAVIGTSSPRRAAQLLRLRPDLRIEPFRGNVQTRLSKVAAGDVSATLLAAAGLNRLGIEAGHAITTDLLLPAPGQAAIGIECRSGDSAIRALLAAIAHRDTVDCVYAERAFTRGLGGSCASPVGALAQGQGRHVILKVQILSTAGDRSLEDEGRFERGDGVGPEALARALLDRAPESIRALFAA